MELPQKYTISEKEMNRRKKAFSSFLLSLFFSVSLTLKLALDIPTMLWFLSMAVFGCILLMGWLLMQKAFHLFEKIVINLTPEFIERKTFKGNEKIFFQDIVAISIKKTIKKKIREIKVRTQKRLFYLNGLENIDNLYQSLKKMVSDDVKTSQRQESIDFDSQYFYPILGLLVGSGTIWLISLIINNYHQSFFKIFLFSIMVLTLGLGGYFIFTKPISKSHGLRFRVVDIVIGIIFIILWMGLLFFILQ
jgi:hypothetical protein